MFFQFFQCFQFSFFQTCFFLKTFSFFWRFFTFFCKNFSPSGHFTRHLLKHRFFLQKAKIKARFWVREEEERRKKKEEGRTRQQKQVSFHNRTHRIFLFFACVETPLSDNIIQNFAVYRDYVFFHPIACKTTARCRPPIGPSKFHWGPRQIRPCRWPSRSHRSSMRPDFTWDSVFSFCATSSSMKTLLQKSLLWWKERSACHGRRKRSRDYSWLGAASQGTDVRKQGQQTWRCSCKRDDQAVAPGEDSHHYDVFFRNASWARWSHQVRGRLRNWCSYQNQMRKQRKVSEATEPSRWRQWSRSGMHHVLLSVWIKKKNLRAGSNCTWEEQQALLASTFKLWWQICCKNTGSGRRTEDQCCGMAVRYAPQRILGSMDVETAFNEATPRLVAQRRITIYARWRG